MVRITVDLLRKRAEHNDGCLSTLEEISLHQQNLEKIDLLGQICPRLKILYLQNNLISKIQNLHKLKELQYLNLAMNNLRQVQNLERCESLEKLDLTINFIETCCLRSLAALQSNVFLRELHMIGNPCTEWQGYRPYVVATLLNLQKLDGQEITITERLAAAASLETWQNELQRDFPQKEVSEEVDGGDDIQETGHVDAEGKIKRPWCPETRVLEHREAERERQTSEDRKAAQQLRSSTNSGRPRRMDFPEIDAGHPFRQKNEGEWDFAVEESEDRLYITLDVALSPYLDISLIKTDIQETFVRLLIKGRLLQLRLPCQVLPDLCTAEKSLITGHLVIKMPKADAAAIPNLLYLKQGTRPATTPVPQRQGELLEKVKCAVVSVHEAEDSVPELPLF